MIAVDTSALMAILLDEPRHRRGARRIATETSRKVPGIWEVPGQPHTDRCMAALEAEHEALISAGTVAEALIVSAMRNVGEEMARLIDGLGFDIVDVTPASARRVAAAYARWGKGNHRAALNFGDCFAYEIAKQHDCPLLYVGNDFARTDIRSAL